MSRQAAGSIVVVDWRVGSMPQEPGRLRPAVVVEDHELFPEEYPQYARGSHDPGRGTRP